MFNFFLEYDEFEYKLFYGNIDILINCSFCFQNNLKYYTLDYKKCLWFGNINSNLELLIKRINI